MQPDKVPCVRDARRAPGPMIHSRRRFLTGALALLAAPAIVRAGSIMPVRAPIPHLDIDFDAEIAKLADKFGEAMMVRWDNERAVIEAFVKDAKRLLIRKLVVEPIYNQIIAAA
jgi:hypothetical protein